MAKIGRPKKPSTLEKERVALMLSNPPANVRRLTDAQIEKLEAHAVLIEKDRHNLLDRYKIYGFAIAEKLIYQLDSIEHEIYDAAHVMKIKKVFNYSSGGHGEGTKATSEKSLIRAKAVWSKNNSLVERIARNTMSINSASTFIIENWNSHGDGKQKPSIRTLYNWFNKFKK